MMLFYWQKSYFLTGLMTCDGRNIMKLNIVTRLRCSLDRSRFSALTQYISGIGQAHEISVFHARELHYTL